MKSKLIDKYNIRTMCIFCKNKNFSTIYKDDYTIPQNLGVIDNCNEDYYWMPYNIIRCNDCNTYQNKYLGELSIVYNNTHIQPIGSIRKDMNEQFSDMIIKNDNIHKILELGGGTGELADTILNKKDVNYTIIDPCYTGNKDKRIIIEDFVQNVNVDDIDADTLIMSHIFEHFYEPNEILMQIKNIKSLKYIYICHPDFDSYLKKKPHTYNFLNIEHTFLIENQFLIDIFNNLSFGLLNEYKCHNYAMLYEFKKNDEKTEVVLRNNIDTYFELYNNDILEKVKHYNTIIDNSTVPVYIWPCSIHSIVLFNYGLNYNKLTGILDNASLKINKYMYGYELKCYNFNEIVEKNEDSIILLNGGCFNKEINVDKYNKIKIIF